MMATLKRKWPQFTVLEKLAVIDRVKRGDSRAKIRQELGVPESTMRGWLKDEEKYRQFAEVIYDNYNNMMAKKWQW